MMMNGSLEQKKMKNDFVVRGNVVRGTVVRWVVWGGENMEEWYLFSSSTVNLHLTKCSTCPNLMRKDGAYSSAEMIIFSVFARRFKHLNELESTATDQKTQ